jgi:hypothetical protein
VLLDREAHVNLGMPVSGGPRQPVCQQRITFGTCMTTGCDQTAGQSDVESALLSSAAIQWVPGVTYGVYVTVCT